MQIKSLITKRAKRRSYNYLHTTLSHFAYRVSLHACLPSTVFFFQINIFEQNLSGILLPSAKQFRSRICPTCVSSLICLQTFLSKISVHVISRHIFKEIAFLCKAVSKLEITSNYKGWSRYLWRQFVKPGSIWLGTCILNIGNQLFW